MIGHLLKTGTTIPYTPVAAVSAGDIIDLGTFAAFAIRDIAAGELGELDSWDSPTYRVNKYTGEAIAQGAPVYYDAGTSTATGTIGYSEAFLGYCADDGGALAGDSTVDVKLASP
jgi:predicted RecA/RadA family phage recombinase